MKWITERLEKLWFWWWNTGVFQDMIFFLHIPVPIKAVSKKIDIRYYSNCTTHFQYCANDVPCCMTSMLTKQFSGRSNQLRYWHTESKLSIIHISRWWVEEVDLGFKIWYCQLIRRGIGGRGSRLSVASSGKRGLHEFIPSGKALPKKSKFQSLILLI